MSSQRVAVIRSHLESLKATSVELVFLEDDVIVATCAGSINLRPKINQDAVAFNSLGALCLCDGHGEFGEVVSNIVSRLVVSTCLTSHDDQTKVAEQAQQALRKELGNKAEYSGCTGVWTFRSLDKRSLIVCNVGDSRCVVVDENWNIVFETKDHKPDEPSEQARIEAAGGRVTKRSSQSVARVAGLALSRAFGDFVATPSGVVALPDVSIVSSTSKVAFVMLISDGVVDAYSTEDVVAFLREKRSEGETLDAALSLLIEACQQKWLVDTAGDYCDDITCAVWMV